MNCSLCLCVSWTGMAHPLFPRVLLQGVLLEHGMMPNACTGFSLPLDSRYLRNPVLSVQVISSLDQAHL